MARTVTLEATDRHPSRPKGEHYEVQGGQALVDLALRRAIAYRVPKETLHLPNKDQTKEADKDTVKPKRKYKRRDLSAQE